MNKQGVINRDVNAAQRASLAVKLRAQRLTFEEIAKRVGYASPGACRNAIMRELQRCAVQDVEEMRAEEGRALDQLQAAVWPLAVPDNDGAQSKKKVNFYAVDRVLAIMERRARLFGLDAAKDSNVIAQAVVVREVPQNYLGLPAPQEPAS